MGLTQHRPHRIVGALLGLTGASLVTVVQVAAQDAAPLEIPLSRLLKGFAQFDLDERNNRLLAQRSPGDR